MSHATAEPRVPVSVITGFLGSGKTTLLNALLKHPGMAETAVLVNEFGEIGIDDLLFEALDDDVVLLAAGCLCCTIREDMIASLRSLSERRAVEVRAEPTAETDPSVQLPDSGPGTGTHHRNF